MKNLLHFEPLSPVKYDTYIEIGTQAYNEHYLHLWPNGNSKNYIENSFTTTVLKKEETNPNTILYLIQLNGLAVGIFKITLHCSWDNFSNQEALYIDKIYILKEHSGKGIGQKVLQFVFLRAKKLNKKIIWLDTMQKGPALGFYLKNGYKIHSARKVPLPNVIVEENMMWVMVKELAEG